MIMLKCLFTTTDRLGTLLRRAIQMTERCITNAPIAQNLSVRYVLVMFLFLWIGSVKLVQSDMPSTHYIFPPGGQRGTTISVRVGACYLHGGAPFQMEGNGVEASSWVKETETIWFEGPMVFKPESQRSEDYPKDHLATFKIAADADLGVHYWRLGTSQGTVPSRQFIVGDLPEVIEDEIDGHPIPMKVELPVTINGRIFPREDIDIWEFHAEAVQSVTCEVHAVRIGSPLDSLIEIRGPSGHRVATNSDYFGSDSFARFTAPKTGFYQVHIHDVGYRGLQHFVYRLTITAGPYIDRVFPLGGRAGSKINFELAGQQVPNENVEVELPRQEPGSLLHYFSWGDSLSNPVAIELSNLDEHIEVEPNNRPDSHQPIELPSVLNGRIDEPGDIDCWTVSAKKDQAFHFELGTLRYGSPLDAVLTISDSAGNKLSTTGSSDNNPVEPETSFTFPADGFYVVQISDYLQRGGPDYAYRLAISKPLDPDFRILLPADAMTLPRGSEGKLKISVERLHGFSGEIALSVNNLPEDVTFSETKIPADKKDIEITLTADEKAKILQRPITILGTASINEKQQTHLAILPGQYGTKDRTGLVLAVSMPTPFKLDGVAFQSSFVSRGTVHRRRFLIDRNGFSGPLTVSLADQQIRHLQGVTGPKLQIPPDVTEFYYPITVPTWLEMNRTGRMVIMALGEVKDEDGKKHKVSYHSDEPNDQIIILTAPSSLSVRTSQHSLRAKPESSFDLGIQIARGVLKPAPVTIELLCPKHVHGIQATTITISADQERGSLPIHFHSTFGPFNMPLIVRATILSEGDPVIAETKVDVVNR